VASVELLHLYSHQPDLQRRLAALLDVPTEADVEPRRQRRQRQTRLDLPAQRLVIEGYEDGQTVYELANRFGVRRQTVSAILQRHGIQRCYKLLTAADVDRARQLYEAGSSLAAIAERLGVAC
jgi:IS30 family transposase